MIHNFASNKIYIQIELYGRMNKSQFNSKLSKNSPLCFEFEITKKKNIEDGANSSWNHSKTKWQLKLMLSLTTTKKTVFCCCCFFLSRVSAKWLCEWTNVTRLISYCHCPHQIRFWMCFIFFLCSLVLNLKIRLKCSKILWNLIHIVLSHVQFAIQISFEAI